MYLSLDTGRINIDIQRIAALIRRFDNIHGRFVSLSRQIDMDVKNKEDVRIALRALENDMENIRRTLRKVLDISEDIIAEYIGAHRANLNDCRDLATDIGTVSYRINVYKDADNSYLFGEYIEQINEKLRIPVSITTPVEAETLERYGLRAIEADLGGNVPVLAWRIPEFN
ncbi:MAG: hypothetical protein GX279_09455 [Clostridiaceae bacterium]|nr:hypothetical protein [Clostridiaceae bacterium]